MNKSIYKKVSNNTSRSELNDFLDLTNSNKPSTGSKKSTRHRSKKSDHKHEFKDVLLRVSTKDPLTGKEKKSLHLGKKCEICNLIRETQWFITESCGNGYSRTLDYDEIIKKYPDYEIIEYV